MPAKLYGVRLIVNCNLKHVVKRLSICSLPQICRVFILFSAGFFISPAIAAWTIQNSGTSKTLNAVEFPVDGSTGYAVGAQGTIVKTSNGGSNWKKQSGRTNASLLDVDFVDNDIGYTVGLNGTIIKTTDGGKKWNAQTSGTTADLYAVIFPVNETVGYAGGENGTLLKTIDGGQSWIGLPSVEGYVRDIVFPVDNTTGYVSTIYGTLGYIFKTTDGGQNWSQVLFLEDAFLESMSFPVDNLTGYVANHDTYTQHGIWKTTDGGLSWNLVTSGIASVPVGVHFPGDTQTGISTGLQGAVLVTSDGGNTWIEGNIGDTNSLNDLVFLDNNVGYTVGGNGLIAKSTDGGLPEEIVTYLHPSGAGSVNAFTDQVGCASDWDCVNDQSGNMGTGLPETVNSLDYIADGSGNRAMFSLDDGVISSGQTVSEICVSVAATQLTGPYAALSYQRIGIDSIPIDSPSFWIGSYWYNGLTEYCWEGLNWTLSDLDTLEIGVVTTNGQWLELAQIFARVFHTPN